MSEKLLPCPFCGGNARALEDGDKFYVTCFGDCCNVAMGERYDRDALPDHFFDSEEDAALAWNTRSTPSCAQLAAARSALAPFAEIADSFDYEGRVLRDEDGIYANTAGDFRRARDAHSMLTQEPPINGWDPRYRMLREGEIIRDGDACLTDSHLGWQPETRCVGTPAPDPSYTSHRMYRRLIDTAQDGVAQRIEQSEPDEGRKDAGSTPVAVADAQEPAGQSEAKPIAWQWRYAGEAEWHTPSGGQKLSNDELQRERPIEQRPLYAHPAMKVSGDAAETSGEDQALAEYLRTGKTHGLRLLPWIGNDVEGEKLAELYAMPAATNVLLEDRGVDLRTWIRDEVLPTFTQQLEAYPGAVIGPAKVLRDPYSAKPYVLFYVTAPAIRALPLTPEGRS